MNGSRERICHPNYNAKCVIEYISDGHLQFQMNLNSLSLSLRVCLSLFNLYNFNSLMSLLFVNSISEVDILGVWVHLYVFSDI